MLFEILITLLTILVTNFLLIKFNFLLDLDGKFEHKTLVKSKKIVPLSGGIVLFILINYFYFQDSIFLISSLSILILGLSSDIDFLRSPKIRIFVQVLILFFYILFSKIYFTDVRINSLNSLLDIYTFALIFNIFCYLVLLNGTNLIDGLNSIILGYYISITIILFIVSFEHNLFIDLKFINVTLSILSVIFLVNFFGKAYMGDGGSYLISFIFGVFLIKFYIQNPLISPYFIMCLLWYPAFENLFSIIRKQIKKISFQTADNKHLHQYLYKFFKKKFNLKKEIINSFTGNLIVLYNLVYFYLIKNFYHNTKVLLFSVTMNISVYVIIYYFLSKKFPDNQSKN